MALEAGTRLGHYEVVSSLGAGGMGEVYRAMDTKLGREVAIKLLLDDVSIRFGIRQPGKESTSRPESHHRANSQYDSDHHQGGDLNDSRQKVVIGGREQKANQ